MTFHYQNKLKGCRCIEGLCMDKDSALICNPVSITTEKPVIPIKDIPKAKSGWGKGAAVLESWKAGMI